MELGYSELIRHWAGLPLTGTQPPCEVKVSDILYIEGGARKLKWCCFLNALVTLTVDQTTGRSYVLIEG